MSKKALNLWIMEVHRYLMLGFDCETEVLNHHMRSECMQATISTIRSVHIQFKPNLSNFNSHYSYI